MAQSVVKNSGVWNYFDGLSGVSHQEFLSDAMDKLMALGIGCHMFMLTRPGISVYYVTGTVQSNTRAILIAFGQVQNGQALYFASREGTTDYYRVVRPENLE